MTSQVNDQLAGVHRLPLHQELYGLFEALVVAHHEHVPVELVLIQTGVRSLDRGVKSD